MTQYKIHEAASLFPMMSDAELQSLADDIKEHGQRNPILMLGDVVIDGRNRLKACELAGVQPKIQKITALLSEREILNQVISLNLHRRHLTQEGRKELVLLLAQERHSTRAIAEKLGISDRSVRRDLESAAAGAAPQEVVGRDGKTYPAKRPQATQAGTFRAAEEPSALPVSTTTQPNAQSAHEEKTSPRLSISTPVERSQGASALYDEAEEKQRIKAAKSAEEKSAVAASVEAHFEKVGPLDPVSLRPSEVPAPIAPSAAPKGAPAIAPSGYDGWNTPPAFCEMIRRLGGGKIALDPCSNKSSHVKAEIELDADLDGLNSDWSAVLKRNRKHGLVYINPPYDIAALSKVQAAQYKQYYLGVESISLVPAKTDQEWFHAALSSAVAIVFWQGRIGFWRDGAPAQGSAFACCSIYYGADVELLTEVVGDLGTVLNLKALRDAARDAV